METMTEEGTRLAVLQSWSQQYGSGDPMFDVLALLLLGVFLLGGIVVFGGWLARRRHDRLAVQLEHLQGLTGRVERIEKGLAEFRTEALRATEFLRTETEQVKEEVAHLRSATTGESLDEIKKKWRDRTSVVEEAPPEIIQPDEEPDASVSSAPEAAAVQVEEPVAADDTSLATRLSRSRRGLLGKLRSFFAGEDRDVSDVLDEVEALLVTSDLGIGLATKSIERVQEQSAKGEEITQELVLEQVKQEMRAILEDGAPERAELIPGAEEGPLVVMVVGVNGAGKTTTCAKLASQCKAAGHSVMMIAADTFRAAAIAQLQEWGVRIDVPVVVGKEEAKPSTVVFDGMDRAVKEKVDVVLIDTAGRLHTKSNLMQELKGIRNAVERHNGKAPQETLLVVDGSTGQNAIQQAREFHASVPLTGLVVTKLDGTPRGGVVVAIKDELGINVRYIGVGESAEDLRVFHPEEFVEALFSDEQAPVQSAHAKTRSERARAVGQ